MTEVSAREAEVLAALAGGRSNAQIARRLHISVRTVESHVSSLLRKYGVADRRELAGLADQPDFNVQAGPGTTFVGRENEQTELLAALASNRLVSLLGPGGVGKTRLALRVAAEIGGSYPYGGAFVDLVPVRPGFVVAAVAEALGVREQPPQTVVEALLERLRRGRTLLVLDNCEHLVDEVGDLVARILERAPDTAVLVTSRERIGVAGERPVQLGPLALGSEAEQLFRDRVALVAPELAADVAARLCAALDGMPLAIELAAARAGSLGPDGLLAALDDRLRLVTGGRGPSERHHSLAQVIGWSYDLLDDAERDLFRRLAVFAGGFDLDAAVALSPAGRTEVSDLLGRLTDKSLLHRTQLDHTSRWRMLETVRAFARDELDQRAEYDAVAALHLAWAASTAERLEARLEQGEDWQSEFDLVNADLRAAVRRPQAHRLARRLAHLTFARKRFVEAREHYLTAAAQAEDAAQLYDDLRDAADAALAIADARHAFELMMRAAAEADRPDAAAYAVSIVNRYDPGPVPDDRGAGLIPDDVDSVAVRIARAWVARTDLTLAETAVEAARQANDPLDLMNALDVYSVALANAGRLADARRTAEERLDLAATLPDHEPRAVAEIVDAFHVASTTAVAVGDLDEALRLARVTDDPVHGHPYITAPRKIRAFALSGLFAEAVEAAEVMWTGWRAAGCPPRAWMASSAATAALAHGLLGTGQDAVWQARALEIARVGDAAESPVLVATATFVDARLALQRLDGGFDGSQEAGKVVERAFADFPEPWWAPYARAAGAELAAATGDPDAERYLALAVSENAWSDAVLQRARGRLTGDRAALTEAAARFERIGARFEHAYTLTLLSHR
ncbi:ATP-binding protein [Kribbella sp. CA-247076]|uniref:ATP-binding protein n=1 Tax=Kribbella sp. CA-247076 TaxID=3239941 RepID=UPI003D923003